VVSVVVPTFRRPGDLERLLASLAAQDASGFEVIVVDNAVDPAVGDLVTAHGFTYLAEPELGVHNARHAGARAASGQLLLFTDDDAECAPGWVSAYAEAFADPSVAAAGGPVRPLFDREPPAWIAELLASRDRFEPYALMDLAPAAVRPDRGFFYSVNMAIRRDLLFELGGFNPEATGDVWLGDGETGLNRKLWERGAPVAYVPGAAVRHRVAADRMTLAYLRRWARTKQGPADAYSRLHPFPFRRRGILAQMARTLGASGPAIARSLLPTRRLDPPTVRRRIAAWTALGELEFYGRLLVRDELWPLVRRERWLT
jgi:glucosyl-dolichyl phosphate glucuronosyltransferase